MGIESDRSVRWERVFLVYMMGPFLSCFAGGTGGRRMKWGRSVRRKVLTRLSVLVSVPLCVNAMCTFPSTLAFSHATHDGTSRRQVSMPLLRKKGREASGDVCVCIYTYMGGYMRCGLWMS